MSIFHYANVMMENSQDLERGDGSPVLVEQANKSTQTPQQDERTKNTLDKFDIATTEVLEFQKTCRDVFVEGWLCEDGDWLSKLNFEQIQFLRDLLGLKLLDRVQVRAMTKDN